MNEKRLVRRAEKTANKRMEDMYEGGYVVFEELSISLDKTFNDFITITGRGGYIKEQDVTQVKFVYDVDLQITRSAAEIAARVVEYICCELDNTELIKGVND